MAWLLRFNHANRPSRTCDRVPSLANGAFRTTARPSPITCPDAKWRTAYRHSDDVPLLGRRRAHPANNEQSHQGFDLITRLDTPDPYTVVFHLRRPFSGFFVNFFSTGGAARASCPASAGTLPNIKQAPTTRCRSGSARSSTAHWKRADSVELVPIRSTSAANPNSRASLQGIPDRNTTMTQLTTHEIDLWLRCRPPSSPGRALPSVTIVRQGSYAYNHLDFELEHGALARPVVRARCVWASTGRRSWRRSGTVWHPPGDAVRTGTPAPHRRAARPVRSAAANAMLDQDGWKRGPDGVRAKGADRLEFNFATGTGLPDTDAMIELIRLNWASWRRSTSVTILRCISRPSTRAASSTTASSTSRLRLVHSPTAIS